MYEKRFQLGRRPFPAAADDSLYYPATGHEAALASLLGGVQEDEGLLLLTAPAGAGKTLLAHALAGRLAADTTSALLTHSDFADAAALLQTILFDLQLPYEEASHQVLRLRLTDFLLKNCAARKRFLLLVDEAHNLKEELIEELRLLGTLEAAGRRAFQAVLFAQPQILETLKRDRLADAAHRLALRCTLEPLGVEEAVDYILHHLRAAGGTPEAIIDEAALEVLARGARGVPRLINQAAHLALRLADAANLDRVDAEAALEALTLLCLSQDAEGEERSAPADNESAAEEPTAPAFEVGGSPATVRLAPASRRTA